MYKIYTKQTISRGGTAMNASKNLEDFIYNIKTDEFEKWKDSYITFKLKLYWFFKKMDKEVFLKHLEKSKKGFKGNIQSDEVIERIFNMSRSTICRWKKTDSGVLGEIYKFLMTFDEQALEILVEQGCNNSDMLSDSFITNSFGINKVTFSKWKLQKGTFRERLYWFFKKMDKEVFLKHLEKSKKGFKQIKKDITLKRVTKIPNATLIRWKKNKDNEPSRFEIYKFLMTFGEKVLEKKLQRMR